jgi:HEPN domain-containing protein
MMEFAAATDGLSEEALFHAQQAAEKSLKAILVASGAEIEKTHGLDALAAGLPQGLAERFDATLLRELTPWVIGGRYPIEDPSEADREKDKLVAAAKATVESAIEIVNMIGQEKTRDDPNHFSPSPSPGLSL